MIDQAFPSHRIESGLAAHVRLSRRRRRSAMIAPCGSGNGLEQLLFFTQISPTHNK